MNNPEPRTDDQVNGNLPRQHLCTVRVPAKILDITDADDRLG